VLAPARPSPALLRALRLILPPLAFAILWLLLFDPRPAPGGDNLSYLLLARGLAEGGGLSEIWLPAAPLHTRYPFAFPALLAPVYALSGGSLPACKIAMGLCGVAAVIATQAYLGRRSLAIGFWGALALALSPLLLEFAGDTFTEAPFLALSILSLSIYDASEQGRRRGRLLAALGLAILGSWVRLIGAALVAAYAMALLRAGRLGAALIAGVALAAALALWLPSLLSRQGYLAELAGTYQLQEREAPPADSVASESAPAPAPEIAPNAGQRISGRFATALRRFFFRPAPLAVALFPWSASHAFPRIAGTLLALSVMALYVARGIRADRGDPAPLYLGLSVTLLFAWSAALERFFLPLLPLVFLAFLSLARERGPRALAATGLLLAASQLAGTAGRVADAIEMRAQVARGNEAAGLPGPLAQSRRAAAWAREGLPPAAVVASRKPPVTFYWSGRRSVPYPPTPDPAAFARGLARDQADYLLVELDGQERAYLVPFYRAYGAKLPLVYETGEPWNVVVLDLAPLRAPGGMTPADRESPWPPPTRRPWR
jgi:hypothetical protein